MACEVALDEVVGPLETTGATYELNSPFSGSTRHGVFLTESVPHGRLRLYQIRPAAWLPPYTTRHLGCRLGCSVWGKKGSIVPEMPTNCEVMLVLLVGPEFTGGLILLTISLSHGIMRGAIWQALEKEMLVDVTIMM